MIYQIHHQKITELSRTDLVAQGEPPKELTGYALSDFMAEWFKDVQTRHPLRDGYQWLICNEESELFVLAVAS